VKRFGFIIFVVVALAGGLVSTGTRCFAADEKAPSADKKPAEEDEGPKITHDAKGNAVIKMSDEAQGDMGIKVEKPVATEINPELTAYGRVLDPAPLVSFASDLAVAQATYVASSNELTRLQTLQGQGNASARALQAAEATAARDQLAVKAARDKFKLAWGNIGEQQNLAGLLQALTSLDAIIVRLDLPAGQTVQFEPTTARLVSLAGKETEARFLGRAAMVDPQLQGLGFLFLVQPNKTRLMPGQALTGFIKVPGEPMAGIAVPRASVVRAEGAGWVYVMNSDGESFTRTRIPLDRVTGAGWFVTNGITATNYLVTTGAQQLLSTEQKGRD